MTESTLKAALVPVLKVVMPGAVVFRHEDKHTAGVPDISVTWRKRTTWLEVKYINPKFIGKEVQLVTAMLLDREGYCYYVLYVDRVTEKYTYIVPPSLQLEDKYYLDLPIPAQYHRSGFDHRFVANFVRMSHEHGIQQPA